MTPYTEFLSGALTAGFIVCGLFFLRLWIRSKDGVFWSFALAFLLLALAQTFVALSGLRHEDQSSIYLLRLAAFAVVITDILRRNLAR
jgi:hypothetical protein